MNRSQRTPKFNVKFLAARQSSCTYSAYSLARYCGAMSGILRLMEAGRPSSMEAKEFPPTPPDKPAVELVWAVENVKLPGLRTELMLQRRTRKLVPNLIECAPFVQVI